LQANDIEHGEGLQSANQGRTVKPASDLKKIMDNIKHEQSYDNAQDHSMISKQATPQQREHLARVQSPDAEFVQHNKAMIVKSVAAGKDLSTIKKTTYDSKQDYQEDISRHSKKASKEKLGEMRRKKVKSYGDHDNEEHMVTYNYKHAMGQRDLSTAKAKALTTDPCFQSMDNSQIRRPGKLGRFVMRDGEMTSSLLDNTMKDRLGGRLGSKYTQRYIDREETQDMMVGNS